MSRGRVAVALPAVLVLLSGCTGWPPTDADARVFNETELPAVVQLQLFDRNGIPVYDDTVAVAPQSMTRGKPIELPAGTYAIAARMAGAEDAVEAYSLGRETPSVKVWVTASGLDVGVSVT